MNRSTSELTLSSSLWSRNTPNMSSSHPDVAFTTNSPTTTFDVLARDLSTSLFRATRHGLHDKNAVLVNPGSDISPSITKESNVLPAKILSKNQGDQRRFPTPGVHKCLAIPILYLFEEPHIYERLLPLHLEPGRECRLHCLRYGVYRRHLALHEDHPWTFPSSSSQDQFPDIG